MSVTNDIINILLVFLSQDKEPSLALSENGGEPPKRRLWRMKRGGEVKKQGESRSASSERGDYVSEGVVPQRGGYGDMREHNTIGADLSATLHCTLHIANC